MITQQEFEDLQQKCPDYFARRCRITVEKCTFSKCPIVWWINEHEKSIQAKIEVTTHAKERI